MLKAVVKAKKRSATSERLINNTKGTGKYPNFSVMKRRATKYLNIYSNVYQN